MANELIINYPSSSTLYALLFDATGNVWNGSAFAAPGSAAWTDYAIAMSEVATATGVYRASMPAAVAGVYGWAVRKQAGGTPAVSDVTVGVGRIEWSGTAEIMPASTTNITGGQINSVSGSIGGNVEGKVLGGGVGVISAIGVSADLAAWKGHTPIDLDARGHVAASLGGIRSVTSYLSSITEIGRRVYLVIDPVIGGRLDPQNCVAGWTARAQYQNEGYPVYNNIWTGLIESNDYTSIVVDKLPTGMPVNTEITLVPFGLGVNQVTLGVLDAQGVADALALASADTPATGSVYDLLGGISDDISNIDIEGPAQLDWRAWETPSGALKDLYDDNAIDVLTGLPSDYAAGNGAAYFSSYVMREFNGSLFVGISNYPINGTGAIVTRLDTPGGTPVFEYNLPEEGVSCMAVNPAGTALYVAGVDVRNNDERCGFYKRDLAGVWTRRNTLRLYPSENGFQHILGITFVGSRIYVCGQATTTAIAWSDDDGITWSYSAHVTPRCYSIGAIGTQLYELGSYDGSAYYELARAQDALWSNYTYPINTQLGSAKNQLVNWGDLLMFGVDTDEIVSVDAAGTIVSHAPPFVLRQTYNNLAVDTDGYLCALGTSGVWRTNDLATWKQVWSFSPADTVRSLGTWGDNLVVSTSGATAAILARPASPEAAAQQMYRDALKLAPSPGTAATGSTDADIADILIDTAAIKAITDDIDVSAVTLATGNNAGDLTFIVGATFDETLTGLTVIPSDWTECYFSLKREKDSDSDSASLIQIKATNGGDVSDGLLYAKGSAPTSPITKASASLTVTQAAGTVRIVVSAAAMALLTGGLSSLDWDVKVFRAGGWSKVVTSGAAEIAWTPTRAV